MPGIPERPERVKSGWLTELSRVEVAHLEALRAIADPYELLVKLAQQQRASSTHVHAIRFAMRFYPRFLTLAASYPRADEDALVHAAKRIFRVTIPTMRRDLKALRGVTNAESAA